ncbi:polymer-forming cytoskeletal protein [Candidatus Fermentibacteria bacterium]|nr:polymer-forming cytoskeletal protein [Candidatus Fermentibacteria bacterium]
MGKEDSPRASSMNSIVGAGSSFTGTLKTEGGLRVDGAVEGQVDVSGTLTVGHDGLIRGDVTAAQAIIGGTVIGTVRADRQLELQSGCRMEGDVFTRSLIVEEGVFFEGNCRMRPEGEREI